jgi:hypothetical protein
MAARVFDQQSTPPTFTCSLQANFLRNVVQEYKRACRRQISRHSNDQEYCPSPYEQGMPVPSRPETEDATMISENARDWVQPGVSFEACRFRAAHTYEREGAFSSDNQDGLVMQTARSNNVSEHVPNMTPISDSAAAQDSSPANWEFTDDDWASLFMNAGFDIADGVFIPV